MLDFALTDSAIVPQKPANLFIERFMAARHKEGYNSNQRIHIFLLCKGLSIDNVVVSRDTLFHEIRPGADFETGDFVFSKLGGYRITTPLLPLLLS